MRWLALALIAASIQQDPKPRRIEVAADSRILLVTTALWLATDGGFYGRGVNADYAAAVRAHFKDHRGHAAVKKADALLRRGFSFDAPVTWILHFSPPPELRQKKKPPDEVVRRAGTPEALEEYARELRDFWKKADFPAFLKSQEAFHAAEIKRVEEVLDAEGCLGRLETWFGEKKDSYTLTVAPLVGGHNYGPAAGADVYQIFNPNNHPDAAKLRRGVTDMVYHEFGHSFVNPVVDGFRDRLKESEELFEPLKESMRRQAYGTWSICMREHFVRAAAYRMLRGEAGDIAARRMVAEDYAKGFKYLPPLYRELDAYEKDRAKFARFADFGSRLVDVIDAIGKEGSEAYLGRQPFGGGINEAWSRPEPAIFVVPSEGKVARYAREVAEKLTFRPKVVTDVEALEMKAGESVFVVYGTPASNKFLAKFAEKLPVQATRDAVRVDGETFEGDKLRLIAAVPNPENPRIPMVIYTATDESLIVGINMVFHGPTGFVVGDPDRKTVAQGFLLRQP